MCECGSIERKCTKVNSQMSWHVKTITLHFIVYTTGSSRAAQQATIIFSIISCDNASKIVFELLFPIFLDIRNDHSIRHAQHMI